MSSKARSDFVVYAYAREGADRFSNVGTYYYIGKGTPKRPYTCSKRYIKCPKDRKKNIHILHDNLDEETAFKIEKELIAKYGRKDVHPEWGILLNRTDGGEGTSGYFNRPGSKKYKPRCWSHVEYGFVYKKSSAELCRMFPHMNLNRHKLNELFTGASNIHKGWIPIKEEKIDASLTLIELSDFFNSEYVKNSIKNFANKSKYQEKSLKSHSRPEETRKLISRRVREKSKLYTWINYRIGIFTGYTISDIWEIYPDHNLDRSTLSKVCAGKQKSHKGWFCLGSTEFE